MEIKYTLEKPYTEKQRLNFIVKYNHNKGLEIKETENAIEAWGYTQSELDNIEQERINNLTIPQQEFWNYLNIEKSVVEERIKQIPELYKKILVDMDNPIYKYNSLIVQVISAIYDIDLNKLFEIG